jgi:hypothetical protein
MTGGPHTETWVWPWRHSREAVRVFLHDLLPACDVFITLLFCLYVVLATAHDNLSTTRLYSLWPLVVLVRDRAQMP